MGEAVLVWGQGVMEISVSSPQFCFEFQTALNKITPSWTNTQARLFQARQYWHFGPANALLCGSPMHLRHSKSILGLYSLDASRDSLAGATRNVFRPCQMSTGRQNSPCGPRPDRLCLGWLCSVQNPCPSLTPQSILLTPMSWLGHHHPCVSSYPWEVLWLPTGLARCP